ncbi:hypothetical protein QBC37DRAFT_456168, partial [Rhypophila decipiens]
MSDTQEMQPEDLLYGFNVAGEESLEYLKSLFEMGLVPPEEIEELKRQSILRGYEEWYMEIDHANARRYIELGDDHPRPYDSSILPFIPTLSRPGPAPAEDDGTGTGVGKKVKKAAPKTKAAPQQKATKPAEKTTPSPPGSRWEDTGSRSSKSPSVRRSERITGNSKQCTPVRGDDDPMNFPGSGHGIVDQGCNIKDIETTPDDKHAQTTAPNSPGHDDDDDEVTSSPTKEIPNTKPQRVYKSAFFKPNTPSQPQSNNNVKTPPKPRPARGTVSCLPIPPLSADNFGLIQEELASDPFRLLVAITFLIRTSGKAAIPVFRELVSRFPTPAAIAIADPAEITALIHPLGLSVVRTAKIQKYARLWLTNPPCRERRYLVKNYPLPGDGDFATAGQEFGPEPDTLGTGGDQDSDSAVARRKSAVGYAWEIGHLTQGRYALDSWRIFCRDVLLGRAENWKGKGREAGFQPEWMRTLPEDKELRACLRWLWMREGWEWNPRTGEREPLREELRRAVDEGRVGYDDVGSLVILE